jgi:hypothetical protein
MTSDPLVEEVRAARDELARRCGYDVGKIFAELRALNRRPDDEHPVATPARPRGQPVAAETALGHPDPA